MTSRPLASGDLVEVKSPGEILATLDDDGALDALPFMPEMVAMCGKRFRVANRVLKTCSYDRRSTMLSFRHERVVTLEDVRCSGEAHDGCQKGCLIFWNESWLRRVGDLDAAEDRDALSRLRGRLKTRSSPGRYYCQASELLKAATPVARGGRFVTSLADIRVRNCTPAEMIRRVAIWSWWRLRRRLLGEFAAGSLTATPAVPLGLQPGERVRVKTLPMIVETLDRLARNRGLRFTPDMSLLCASRQIVKRRVERIIVDGTGEMRELRDTVFLERSHCGCPHVAFGGCPRAEFTYWREIWLERDAPNGVHSAPGA